MVAGGSNVQSNNWFIDGIETTAPETGTAWIYVNPDAVQEVQVMHIGAPAEYGNMLGAAFNVVTKSGSNQFKGGVNAYWFDDSLVDSDINFDSEYPEYHLERVHGHHRHPRRTDCQGPAVVLRQLRVLAMRTRPIPGPTPTATSTRFSTATVTASSCRGGSTTATSSTLKGGFVDWGYPPSASEYHRTVCERGREGPRQDAGGSTTRSIFSDRTFLEARYTGFTVYDDCLSETGSTEAAYIDYSPPGGGPAIYFGGLVYPWHLRHHPRPGNVTVTHFADDWLAGDHDFKFGVQASKGAADTQVAVSATGSYYYHYYYAYDYYGTIYPYDYYYKVDGLPYWYGNEQKADLGLCRRFVEDQRSPDPQPRPPLRLPQGHHPVLPAPGPRRQLRPVR